MATSTLSISAGTAGRPTLVVLDKISDTLSYVGKAAPNSDTADPVWQVRKIETVGSVLSVLYAEGNDRFDNIWDDRASLSYS